MRSLYLAVIAVSIILAGCAERKTENLIVFHAGSLSVPVKKLNETFEKANPGVRVLSEAAGSISTVRKVTELGKECDIILSADYQVIDKMLIPGYASWNVRFATNEIVIAYRPESKYADIIDSTNWYDLLLRKDVIFGRSDPDADPCGYRTIFAMVLASGYYERPGLADSMLMKDRDYIRPMEVDLVALEETGVIDYMFQYRSVAVQHGFRYLRLPAEINLSDPRLADSYSTVTYMIPGDSPGTRKEVKGDYISYSGAILKNAAHKKLAIKYFKLLLGEEGREILRSSGQEPLTPPEAFPDTDLPAELTPFLIREEE